MLFCHEQAYIEQDRVLAQLRERFGAAFTPIVLTANERTAIAARVMLDEALTGELDAWICSHYRDRLVPADVADPSLLDESRHALDELTRILLLPRV